MSKNAFLIIIALTCLWACEQETGPVPAPKPDLDEVLPGTWEITLMRVNVNSYENRDTNFVFEISEGNWERTYKIRPYRTFFSRDSTFTIVRRSLDSDVISEERGLWKTFGDTLMLLQRDVTLQYLVDLQNGMTHMTGLIDFDNDGSEDDEYYSIHRYVGKGENQ